MAAVRDLYEVLGVGHDATDDDIRRAYRRLARELHPDVNGDPLAEDRFKEIAGAYEILSDPDKRARYDAFGSAGEAAGAPFSDIQDIFDLFFGQGGFGSSTRRRGPRSRTQQGEDLGVHLTLAFREAAFGVRRDVEIERLVVCDRCLGNGAEPGTAPVACRTCGGTGQVQAVRRSVFGTVMTTAPCGTCRGTGQEVLDPCEACFGQGRRQEPTTVAVDIPGGVSDGMELRVTGAGHAGIAGGPAGDLYVGLAVQSSPSFDRRGQDLYTVLDVSMTQATLGAEIEIEGLDGPERIRVAPGTDSGTVLRLKGRGVPNVNRRGRGDLFVTIHSSTPGELSREERSLWERLAEIRGEGTSKGEPARGTLRRPEF
jgi:molecular chaperone DnaJ